MCGLIGYIGNNAVAPTLLSGLKSLEYRGYDSAGIALNDNNEIDVFKAEGKLENLRKLLEAPTCKRLAPRLGIGHIRWATHGKATTANAHPHLSNDGRLVLVHNGIIENYQELRRMLEAEGFVFHSETDTETAVHLIDREYKKRGSLEEAVIAGVKQLCGAFAFCIMHKDEPDKIIAVRQNAPLIIGLGQGENFIASDIPAIIGKTRNIIHLADGELAVVRRESVEVKNLNGENVIKPVEEIEFSPDVISKLGYKHFMLKEIHEQPESIKRTVLPRITDGMPDITECGLTDEKLRSYKNIFVVACGTAMHAGLVGKYVIEKIGRIPVTVDVASEFRYRDPIISKGDLVILVSQSGETADTKAALHLAHDLGADTLGIVNAKGSAIAREADMVLYTHAGPEISVASTKAYMVQLAVFYLLAFRLSYVRGAITEEQCMSYTEKLLGIPELIEKILEKPETCQFAASRLVADEHLLYIGRGLDYALSMEGSLKLKEISYIHSESYAAGELKHGTISLITEDMPVIAVATQRDVLDKTVSNIKEVKSRGAFTIVVTREGTDFDKDVADILVTVPETDDLLMPMTAVVPLQLIAYYTADLRGNDVDKPRNLAKSVTVE